MPEFRKKPVVIEARQLLGLESDVQIAEWCGGYFNPDGFLAIVTLEGVMIAEASDYVIRGVAGEFYPCKAAIFEQTYDPVSGDGDA